MTQKKLHTTLLICTICSIGIVALMFAFTNKGVERDNSIVRQFPSELVKKVNEMDLIYDSYYIAGAAEGQIYLGNFGAPSRLLILDTTVQNKREVRLSVDQDSLAVQSVQLRVVPPHFFVIDGTVPFIFRGNTTDWKASSIMDQPFYFSQAQVMDSTSLAIRARSSRTREFILGKINLSDTAKISLSDKLLQKQLDGIFDTDGILQYNRQLHRLVYTYFYRNQYIVANDSLQLQLLGNTIDTISHAQLQVSTIASKNQRKLAAPPLRVNKYSATYGNYLFVNSKLLGRDEPLEMWEAASVIDVYNLVENTYQFSFYIDDIGQDKLKIFQVLNDKFIGLIGNHIVSYQLNGDRFKDLQTAAATAMDPTTSYYQ